MRSTVSSSKRTYKKDKSEEEGEGKDDLVVEEVPDTDKADMISVENGTTVSARVCNVNDYHQADFFRETRADQGSTFSALS